MPETGTTALVVLLPAAEPLLAAARRVAPKLVRPGLPAHVTALYPFLPAGALTGDVERAVRELAAGAGPVEVELAGVATAPGFAAVPVPALRAVTDAACDRWPDVPPYGGRFGARPAPHLTLATGGTDAGLARVAAEVRPLLPVRDRATELHLVELAADGWRRRLAAPLGRP